MAVSGFVNGLKTYARTASSATARFSKAHLPASVHNNAAKGINSTKEIVKKNPLAATALGAGTVGLGAGAIIG